MIERKRSVGTLRRYRALDIHRHHARRLYPVHPQAPRSSGSRCIFALERQHRNEEDQATPAANASPAGDQQVPMPIPALPSPPSFPEGGLQAWLTVIGGYVLAGLPLDRGPVLLQCCAMAFRICISQI